jgi:Ser/Thr protein kinase RdoA (MazF antagonist)
LLNNAVYAVTAGDGTRFALRVHRPLYRLPEHSRSELQFLESAHATLTGAGIRVPVPVLMAARHAAQILRAASLVHSNGSPELDTAEHIAYRMHEVRRCLAMSTVP